MDVAQLIATIIFGSGGAVGAFAALRARRAQHRGLPRREQQAAVSARVPGWDVLTAYYERELETLRGDMRSELKDVRQEVGRLARLRDLDAQYIDALEAHIWQGKPPPPPARPQYPSIPQEDPQ